jgi:hypothetical protein
VASSVRAQLGRAARDICALGEDLGPLVSDAADHPVVREQATADQEAPWRRRVGAPHALGSDVHVEGWTLAEHFLLAWLEWSGWTERFRTYSGSGSDEEPPVWRKARHVGSRIAPRLLSDAALAEMLVDRIGQRDADHPDRPEQVFRLAVECDQWRRLGRALRDAHNPTGPMIAERSENLDSHLREVVAGLPAGSRTQLNRFLRDYRHTMLRLSWLDGEEGHGPESSLWHEQEAEIAMDWIDEVVRRLGGDGPDVLVDVLPMVRRTLDWIGRTITEVGYDRFVDDVLSGDLGPGQAGGERRDPINLIPSRETGRCRAVLVAVSRGAGRRAPTGFERILQAVRTHLIECAGTTKVVIVLCDTWDAAAFEELHFDELAAHHRKGVRFALLQVGAPRRVLAPIALDLARR